MTNVDDTQTTSALSGLPGRRKGPYLSHNPVSRTQIWQWCSAMGDHNPLYLNAEYQRSVGINNAVAPPAMMQMWTMRDVNMRYAPGSTDEEPYEVIHLLTQMGFPGNVAVSYDLHFHRLLQEGDLAHHYNTIDSISDLKTTALGKGHFFVEHAEFFDQHNTLFAEAFITYFQYQPMPDSVAQRNAARQDSSLQDDVPSQNHGDVDARRPNFATLDAQALRAGDTLPELRLPITHKLIVTGAIAGQDFVDVHHNAPAAQAAGMPDIFMNILTTCGLCARYLTDWAGPESRLQRLRLQLLAPNTPGDTMVLQGRVSSVNTTTETAQTSVEFAGKNSLGLHVTGSATLALPASPPTKHQE